MREQWSLGQVAAALGVSRDTVRRWDAEGKIPQSHRTQGGHRRWYRDDFEEPTPRVMFIPEPDVFAALRPLPPAQWGEFINASIRTSGLGDAQVVAAQRRADEAFARWQRMPLAREEEGFQKWKAASDEAEKLRKEAGHE